MRILLAFIVLLLTGPAAVAQHIRVSDRVFLIPDRPGSTTRFEMIVNAGSSDEAGGKSRGIAHYLEHLVLVGRNASHGDAAVRFFADASSNGWTNDRATVYLHTLPARAEGPAADLEKLFNFYAARLGSFDITEADAARERNVVLQEHDLRIQSNPTSMFWRDLNTRVIPDHPSGTWTIGTRETIQSMTLDEARAFHQTWYAPNNVWFVVRGNITVDALKVIADKALTGIAERPLPPRSRDRQPEVGAAQTDFRMKSDKVARTLVSVSRVVRTAPVDRIRLQAQITLLSSFMNSRFPRSAFDQLVEVEQMASDDLSVYLREIAPDTIAVTVAGSVAAEKSPEALKNTMENYLGRLAIDGLPNDDQLARLKKRIVEASRRTDAQAVQAHGRLVSWLADGRPPDRLKEWPALTSAINKEELALFAVAISGPGTRAVGILEPTDAVQ